MADKIDQRADAQIGAMDPEAEIIAASQENWLEYDPGTFAKDRRYAEGKNTLDLKAYAEERFSSNAKNMEVLNAKTTRSYIRNQSNIYKHGVIYTGTMDIKNRGNQPRWYKRLRVSRINLERYVHLTGKALSWTYTKVINRKKEVFFKALDSSRYYIAYDDFDVISNIIVIIGSRLKNGDVHYIFSNWDVKTKKVYKQSQKTWLDLGKGSKDPVNNDNWVYHANFKNLPFTEVSDDESAAPSHTTLIDIDNETMAGDAYNRYTMILSSMVKFGIYSIAGMPKIDKMAKDFGKLDSVFKAGDAGDIIKAIEQPGTTNQMNYRSYIMEFLKFVAQADGVDLLGLFPDLPDESGVARRMRRSNVDDTREEYISVFEEFELDDWIVINQESDLPIPANIIYNPLPSQIDPIDQADIDNKRQLYLSSQYQDKVITFEMFVRASNKGLPEKDIQKIITEAEKLVSDQNEVRKMITESLKSKTENKEQAA